jgi:2-polyprenyl-3-methyl-5-hydroxy-6-metoxy-1,4-benzoquinol methylase
MFHRPGARHLSHGARAASIANKVAASTHDGAEVNSPQWWEDYFRSEWDKNGGAEQTRHFMQRLIAELPAVEAEYLRAQPVTILDWGCAHGEGVDELARAFPAARVRGLDASANAIEQARRRFPEREFVHAPRGELPASDVVVSSNCLEHFADPWPVAERLARAATQLLVLLVPCAEEPLCESHLVRFDEDSFPGRIGPLHRLVLERIAVDPRQWGGDQLLAVYASAQYLAQRGQAPGAERAKWDAYYAAADLPAETPMQARFCAEFAEAVSALLPGGGRVLEAGAGAGWHSLALARTGRFQVTLLDFSEQALRHARALFEREGCTASFVLADAREPGAAEYDLVFNSGVLEHFPFADQVQLVQAMASRSTNLVLALVPNRRCYWYWFWRVQAAARGDWPFGKELPAGTLAPVFAAAGLDVVGERVLGEAWTESFFDYLDGIDPAFRDCLLAVHRSPLLDADVKGYLLGALGRVSGAPGTPAPGWARDRADGGDAELASALADALAVQIHGHGQLLRSQEEATRHAAERDRLQRQLQENSTRHDAECARLQAELQQEIARGAADRTGHVEQARALTARADAGEAEAARLSAELAASREQGAQQCRELAERLRAASAVHEQLAKERDALRQTCQELQAWHGHVSRSLTFRLLRRLDRVRAFLGGRGPVSG